MFNKSKADKKVAAFRSSNIKVVKYTPSDGTTVTLKAGKYMITMAITLVELDNKIQLAFSGDIIATDGKSLSRIMKALWNNEIPEFELSDDLRKQLGKKSIPVDIKDKDNADPRLGVKPVNVEREPILFKDMAQYVAGLGNDVVVTTKRTFNIDE